jgi:membrane-associated phospholipid phosphatase
MNVSKRLHLAGLTIVLCSGLHAPGRADVVTEWNAAALAAVRAGRTTPPAASRQLAILHAAMYDAVNGIARTHEHYVVPSAVPASASRVAAASAAAHRVLREFHPANTWQYDALHAAVLDTIPPGPKRALGAAWGQTVAEQILAWRAGDGYDQTIAVPALSGDGFWVPTPPAFAPFLLPQWGFLDCFVMLDHAQFRPPGPPAPESAEYAEAFNEVKAVGAAVGSTRTAQQTEIALFWADNVGTETPPGHWNHIAADVAIAAGNTLEENARVFALLNLALADAAVCAWDAKYYFYNWRPVTAIRHADEDGNPWTEADPDWSSFVPTPPFPDYVSGHSAFSGAAATVLALFFGTDDFAFTANSDGLPGVYRSFSRFSAAAEEAMNSRLYGGIHYRFANEDGLVAGLGIGEWTFSHYLQPKTGRSRKP